jgi:hypothetical protein
MMTDPHDPHAKPAGPHHDPADKLANHIESQARAFAADLRHHKAKATVILNGPPVPPPAPNPDLGADLGQVAGGVGQAVGGVASGVADVGAAVGYLADSLHAGVDDFFSSLRHALGI